MKLGVGVEFKVSKVGEAVYMVQSSRTRPYLVSYLESMDRDNDGDRDMDRDRNRDRDRDGGMGEWVGVGVGIRIRIQIQIRIQMRVEAGLTRWPKRALIAA